MIFLIIFQHGVQLKAATAMVRLRLYSCLLKIPAKQYDGAFANLLRQLGTCGLRVLDMIFETLLEFSQNMRSCGKAKKNLN